MQTQLEAVVPSDNLQAGPEQKLSTSGCVLFILLTFGRFIALFSFSYYHLFHVTDVLANLKSLQVAFMIILIPASPSRP